MQVLGLRFELEQGETVGDHGAQVAWRGVQEQRIGLQLGEIQDVIHQMQHQCGAVLGSREVLLALFFLVEVALYHFQRADYCVQRVPELVCRRSKSHCLHR